jgi:tRNA 2-thiocytidine biosynthesis protein TtcA
MDRNLFGFADLKATGEALPDGDIAFDEEPCATTPSHVVLFSDPAE